MSGQEVPKSSTAAQSISEDSVSVTDLAVQLGKRKQTLFKVIRRLRIEPIKRRSAGRRGQLVSYVTAQESRLIATELRSLAPRSRSRGTLTTPPEHLPDEQGVFYLLQLEPEHDPGRIKVGFAVSLPERLRTLRCSAPFTKVVQTWPCKVLWERTAIESVTDSCKQLHTEVFRTASIESVVQRCDQFFGLMPKLQGRGDLTE